MESERGRNLISSLTIMSFLQFFYKSEKINAEFLTILSEVFIQ